MGEVSARYVDSLRAVRFQRTWMISRGNMLEKIDIEREVPKRGDIGCASGARLEV